jgi:hypothetical protein
MIHVTFVHQWLLGERKAGEHRVDEATFVLGVSSESHLTKAIINQKQKKTTGIGSP